MSESRNPTCEEVEAMLPSLLDDAGMTLALRRHISRCAGCRGELEAYRSVRAAAAGLATVTVAVPAGLRDSLVAIPSQSSRLDEVRAHVARHRRVYVGGLLAAGATGAALWRIRRRGLATA